MANKIDLFWEILKSVSGGNGNITKSLNAIAKSDRTKLETYFHNVVDQPAFATNDYYRLRKFLIDLYASHRALTTSSVKLTDPHSLSNSDLDELFRSFGFNHSAQLKGNDENPIEQKVQFFLDLVNLYKVKGTPQSLLDVLQYYGVTNINIYEFFLKLNNSNRLIFEGTPVSTSRALLGNIIYESFDEMCSSDPHWLYTEQQIINSISQNKISLPSKAPYIGISPLVTLDGPEISILVRKVQDEYDHYQNTGKLPDDTAIISTLGESATLLELYLLVNYLFNELYPNKTTIAPNFLCYNGTNTIISNIINEYNEINSTPQNRNDIKIKHNQFLELFTRESSLNFLIDKNSASNTLDIISPELKSRILTGGLNIETLYSLIKDLADWVKINIGSGFVDFEFILYGLDSFFRDLKPVIEFFKPYRSRILLFESFNILSRLNNSIIIEDNAFTNINEDITDFIVGNSQPCLDESEDATSNINFVNVYQSSGIFEDVDPTVFNNLEDGVFEDIINSINRYTSGKGSRELVDCGSYLDIGAVVGAQELEMDIYENKSECLRCPCSDTEGFVVSEIMKSRSSAGMAVNTIQLSTGLTSITINLDRTRSNTDYYVITYLRRTDDLLTNPITISTVITEKTKTDYTITFTSTIDADDYYLDYWVLDEHINIFKGEKILPQNSLSISNFNLPSNLTNYYVHLTLINEIDSPIPINMNIDMGNNDFTVYFSTEIPTSNYRLQWVVFNLNDYPHNSENLSIGDREATITFHNEKINDNTYPLFGYIVGYNAIDGYFKVGIDVWVQEKFTNEFTLVFSEEIPNIAYNTYSLRWFIPNVLSNDLGALSSFYQSGQFRDFDEEGQFDCTHGFDLVSIYVNDLNYLLLEDEVSYLLQENGSGILILR